LYEQYSHASACLIDDQMALSYHNQQLSYVKLCSVGGTDVLS
jgi:hypothetical protein